MVGTRKGTFLFSSDLARRQWRCAHHHGDWSVHALNYDARNRMMYAATNHNYLSQSTTIQRTEVQNSVKSGAKWHAAKSGPNFDDQRNAWQIWQVVHGHPQRPGEVWAGTREAGLFRSSDWGETWEAVPGLNNHPTCSTWQAGGGGLLLHTIIVDPDEPRRLYACISMGGAFRSEDGGVSWQPINHGLAEGLPNLRPGTHQCVHKMVLHPLRTSVLFQQHHCGVYRSNDRGDHWSDISEGLPSRFGFPLAIHPHDPDTIYLVPHVSDYQRMVPDGHLAVWRSRTGGDSWESLTHGLPENAWFTILRENLAVDGCDPAGVYVGTSSGQLYYSRDEGTHWELLADHLPSIISVNSAYIAE